MHQQPLLRLAIIAFLPAFVLSALVLFSGCYSDNLEQTEQQNQSNEQNEHGHAHDPSDVLVWKVKDKIDNSEFEIWYGHHGDHFHAGDTIEPAVAITLSGNPVADAKVFNQLVDPDNRATVLVEEVATVYEPETDEEIAHYAQGDLVIPSEATKCVIQFRIELPGQADPINKDVEISVGH